MKNKSRTSILQDWFATIVVLISVVELTAISVRYGYDPDGFALDFQREDSTERSACFDYVFYIWVGCIVAVLTRKALFAIGKAIDSDGLMFLSLRVIGRSRYCVSF